MSGAETVLSIESLFTNLENNIEYSFFLDLNSGTIAQ